MSGVPLDHGDWTTSGAFEIAEDTFRIPLSMPNDGLKAVNVYLVRDGDAVALVDAGWSTDTSLAELTEALAAIGLAVSDIDMILVTHVHHDHYSLAMRLRRISGCKVFLGRGEQATIERIIAGTGRSLAAQRSRLALCGANGELETLDLMVAERDPRAWVTDEFEEPDAWLEGRESVAVGERTLLAVATPGHTRGHTCFLDARHGLAFTGDHVLPHITPSVGFEAATTQRGLDDYMESLRLSQSWTGYRLLPAHGPAEGSVTDRATQLIDHHEARLAEIALTVQDQPLSVHGVAAKLPWTGRRRAFEELDPFHRVMACLETLAHVELLARRGTLTVAPHGDHVLVAPS